MSIFLPNVIKGYFQFANSGDEKYLESCFLTQATVFDEGQIHQGYDAIKSWMRSARKKFVYQVEPHSVTRSDSENTLLVTATLAGNFPGSPVEIEHLFHLSNKKIKSLEIR